MMRFRNINDINKQMVSERERSYNLGGSNYKSTDHSLMSSEYVFSNPYPYPKREETRISNNNDEKENYKKKLLHLEDELHLLKKKMNSKTNKIEETGTVNSLENEIKLKNKLLEQIKREKEMLLDKKREIERNNSKSSREKKIVRRNSAVTIGSRGSRGIQSLNTSNIGKKNIPNSKTPNKDQLITENNKMKNDISQLESLIKDKKDEIFFDNFENGSYDYKISEVEYWKRKYEYLAHSVLSKISNIKKENLIEKANYLDQIDLINKQNSDEVEKLKAHYERILNDKEIEISKWKLENEALANKVLSVKEILKVDIMNQKRHKNN
jgi:hypothetical protein